MIWFKHPFIPDMPNGTVVSYHVSFRRQKTMEYILCSHFHDSTVTTLEIVPYDQLCKILNYLSRNIPTGVKTEIQKSAL